MGHSVLGSVTLGYQCVWNAWRKRCATRLWVEPLSSSAVSVPHLLQSLQELWPSDVSSAVYILCPQTIGLLGDLLDHAPAGPLWVEVPDLWLDDALIAGRVRRAHQRGLKLLWRGDDGQSPDTALQPLFHKTLRSLTPHQALAALRAALRRTHDGGSSTTSATPLLAGALYDGLPSQALVEHALDQQGAWGVAGWPTDETLYGYRYRQIQPARQALLDLVHAIDADASLDTLEHGLGHEPLLCYRFLRYANSAALSVRHEIDSVRQGLMTLGYARLRAWLMEQMPHASSDANLNPIRAGMVLRARTMEHLTDAGIEDDLRREVFLCGVLSQVDLLLGESLGSALHRIPLPGRVTSALLGQTGPYAPWLEVATVLEGSNTKVIRDVCRAHDLEADAVNRAVLRALAAPL
jgi:c-di-GMP phosphodiesterase